MSKAKSMDEAMIPMEKEKQAKGNPEKAQPSVKSTLPQGMKAPEAAGEKGMGGVHKGGDESTHIGHASMGHARRHLEMETERGEHAAEVGGHMMHEHSGRHGHK